MKIQLVKNKRDFKSALDSISLKFDLEKFIFEILLEYEPQTYRLALL